MGGVEVRAPVPAGCEAILSGEALEFVADLQRTFGGRREELLAARAARQERLLAGELPEFLEETRAVREDGRGGSRRRRRTCGTAGSRSPGRPTGRW